METVGFTQMAEGTRDDYLLLGRLEKEHAAELPGRLLRHLLELKDSFSGHRVDRLEHSLQSATRAHRDGASEEMVVVALLHDIGDMLAPLNHSEMAAAVLKPVVSEEAHWIVRHHGLFQSYYYAHHLGGDRNARDRYRDHPFFEATVRFCEQWDQPSFDPAYHTMPLETFEPMVRRIFALQARSDVERL